MQLHFCLFEDAVILDESFYLQSDFSFYKMNNNQRFCDNLALRFFYVRGLSQKVVYFLCNKKVIRSIAIKFYFCIFPL